MSTMTSISIFLSTALQPHPYFQRCWDSLIIPGKCKATSSFCFSHYRSSAAWPSADYLFDVLCSYLHKTSAAAFLVINEASFQRQPAGREIEAQVQLSSSNSNFCSPQDDQQFCPTCGLPVSDSCPGCDENFCSRHTYQCGDCLNTFCTDCFNLHSADGHWCDSATTDALINSTRSQLARGQQTYRLRAASQHNPRSPNHSCETLRSHNSLSDSRPSKLRAFMAHSLRRLVPIFTALSAEAIQ